MTIARKVCLFHCHIVKFPNQIAMMGLILYVEYKIEIIHDDKLGKH